MASVQLQGQNAGAHTNGNPAALTSDINPVVLHKMYREMIQNQVPENNPDFIRIKTELVNIARLDQIKKQQAQQLANQQRQQQAPQQALQQQQQQHIKQQQGTNNQQIGLGLDRLQSNGSTPAAPLLSSKPPTNDVRSAIQDSSPQIRATTAPMHHALTPSQRNTIALQFEAFQRLSRNIALPSQLKDALFAKTFPQPPTSHRDPFNRYKAYADPYLSLPNALYSDLRLNRYVVPAATPPGVDVAKLLGDREMIVFNRIEARKQEIANMIPNISSLDSSAFLLHTEDAEDADLKRKLLIEFKKLNLRQKQINLRSVVAQKMMSSDNLLMTINRSHYRQAKRQNIKEAASMAEKLETQRNVRIGKEHTRRNGFIQAIVKRAQELKTAQDKKRSRLDMLGERMLMQHQLLEKEEQRRIERNAKQRLQALKANDEETYLKLLGQAKDTRISHLLAQTNGFLKQLASSVKVQQRASAVQYSNQSPLSDEEDEEDEVKGDDDGPVDYYAVAHKVKEEIHQQSPNLVGGTLKEYQIKGLQWMISLFNNNLNGILADEMGLGKTIQTISLITYLLHFKNQKGPYLVIVPLSTLTNWNNEFERWAPTVKKIVYKGAPNQRKAHQNQIRWGEFQVLLTTYEYIIKDRPVLSKLKWTYMIVDEGHRMKNAKSKLSSTLTQYYHTRYRLILTGTPLQNSLPELWALLNFVLPNIFKSVKSFDEWFNTPFANTGGQDRIDLSEEEQLLVIRRLHKVLRPFLLRRLKKDVEKDLPNKTERVIKCSFSALQGKLYRQLVKNNKFVVSDGKGGKTGIRGLSNMLMQLRKICNHPFVFSEVEDQMNPDRLINDLLWRTAGKFELLDRILPKFQASGHRVLMFFQMTKIMDIMEEYMRYRNFQFLRLDGSTKADERSDLLGLFNAPNSPFFCFLLSTRAGGLGLNLQTADTVIIFDSDWNPHQDLQAQDRAHRIGQKNEVRILRLITSNSIEEKILERANYKLDMDGKVIQAGKFDNKSTNEERDAMLKIMMESAEVAEQLDQEEMGDEDLNLMMMRSDEELVLFQQMDEERLRTDIYGPGRQYQRLMNDDELPEIYIQEEIPPEEIIAEELGRGARKREGVAYDDGLTEEQWLEAVDNSDDDVEAAIARKAARIARKNGGAKDKLAYGDDVSPVISRASSGSPAPKKRGRKPKGIPDKRKREEIEPDSMPELLMPRKRGRKAQVKADETLSPEDRAKFQRVMKSVCDRLENLEVILEGDEVPRDVIPMFKTLPNRTDYPDYYTLIKRQISMKQVEKKIEKEEYQTVAEFYADIKLMCDNCRYFNETTSVLYSDANLIQKTTIATLNKELEDRPEWLPYATAADLEIPAPVVFDAINGNCGLGGDAYMHG